MSTALFRAFATVIILWAILYAGGSLVLYRNVKVNYTRKVVHFGWLLLPLLLIRVFPGEGTRLSDLLVFLALPIIFIPFVHPIRTRVPFVHRMFLAIDRPEDRPYTLRWWWLQIITSGVANVIGSAILISFDHAEFLVLTPLLAAVGDGLAEPIGVRFGRRKYRVYTWLGDADMKHYRTVEGSAAVFLATFVLILLYRDYFTASELLAALLIVPGAITIAEAASPHTVDAAFLMLSASASLLAAKYVA